jgi:hypothetical protein
MARAEQLWRAVGATGSGAGQATHHFLYFLFAICSSQVFLDLDFFVELLFSNFFLELFSKNFSSIFCF